MRANILPTKRSVLLSTRNKFAVAIYGFAQESSFPVGADAFYSR